MPNTSRDLVADDMTSDEVEMLDAQDQQREPEDRGGSGRRLMKVIGWPIPPRGEQPAGPVLVDIECLCESLSTESNGLITGTISSSGIDDIEVARPGARFPGAGPSNKR